ncbi:hypothetical protein HZP82_15730 [Elizabethkingia anophelis]|nr:hypothetical protein [Elizabethkingia anophelis]MCT4106467.1 hypothetical protein [Elizabethkingia anophelis]
MAIKEHYFEAFLNELSKENFIKKDNVLTKKNTDALEKVTIDTDSETILFERIKIQDSNRFVNKKRISFDDLPSLYYKANSTVIVLLREYLRSY